MSLQNKFINGVAWSFIENMGLRIVSVSLFFLLAILLDPEAFGLVALASAFTSFGNRIVEQGLGTAIIQHDNLEEAHISSAFWGNLGIGVLFTLFTFLFAPWIAGLFGEDALTGVLRWFSLSFVFVSVGKVQESLLQKEFHFKVLAKRRIIAILSGGVVGITMALQGMGVYSLVGQILVFQAVQSIVLWIESSWKPKFYFSLSHYLVLFSFGAKMMLSKIVSYFNEYGADLLIGYFLGTTVLGYYAIAYKVYKVIVDQVTNTVTKASLPLFSKLQNQKEELNKALLKITLYACYISLPIFTSVILLAPTVVPTIFGEKWIPSITSMQLLAGAGMLLTIFRIVDTAVIALGHPMTSLKVLLLNSIGGMLFFYLAVDYGIEAVAATFVLRVILIYPILFYFAKPLIGFFPGEFLKNLGKPFFATLIAISTFGIIFMMLSSNPILLWTLGGVACIGTYIWMSHLLNPEIYKKIQSQFSKR